LARNSVLFGARLIAHRGLHDASAGLVENSLPSFEAAIARGYAIETDVQAARWGEPVIFHDSTLDRLTALTGRVSWQPAPLLGQCSLAGTASTIPSLGAFFACVRGRVPIFLEIKSNWPSDPLFLRKILRHVSAYRGPLAIMSFDPAVLAFFRLALPHLPRGLSAERGFSRANRRGWTVAHAMAVARPDFLAVEAGALADPLIRRLAREARLPLAAWTLKSERDGFAALQRAEAIIFEGFHPDRPARIYNLGRTYRLSGRAGSRIEQRAEIIRAMAGEGSRQSRRYSARRLG
jgi:glycerophosphoryl diester phosphodiesterase